MKRIMTRSLIVWIVTFLFMAGTIFLGVRVVLYHNDWVQQPYNGHIISNGGLSRAGAITDRSGRKLAYSETTRAIMTQTSPPAKRCFTS